ncbi:MAG: TatD family hydrolase [Defluviitaleaceae bacterium]|nr:TatD family hydrolase [Defluviitaleaceae bacterium]
MYFETHAHYTSKQFDEDRYKILELLAHSDIKYIVNIGSDLKSSIFGVELAKKYSFLYATVGYHPHDVSKMTKEDFIKIEELAKDEKVVAIGEIGLDFYYDFSPRDIQEYWFLEQLKLVRKTNLPVVIHCRDAYGKTFDILKDAKLTRTNGPGVIHCYSGSLENAKEYVKMGYYIGVGGVITYKNAKSLVEVVENIPLEFLLIETDAPYLSPVPNRGKRNDSFNLSFIVNQIARIKNVAPSEVAKVTTENAKRFYNIKD